MIAVLNSRGFEKLTYQRSAEIGSSEEFVGESVGVTLMHLAGIRPCDPLKTNTRTLLRRKNKKHSAALPLVGAEQDASHGG